VTGLTSIRRSSTTPSKTAVLTMPRSAKTHEGKSGEELFFELAHRGFTQAADLVPAHLRRTKRVDGWVSLEVSPLLAHNTTSTLAAAKSLHARAGRPNLLIKIPGTKEGLPAIEEAIFAGRAVNVTLLFSASSTWRRLKLSCAVSSDASMPAFRPRSLPSPQFSSAVGRCSRRQGARSLNNKLGIAIEAHLQGVPRPARLRSLAADANAGARPQRRCGRATGTKDPRPRMFSISRRWLRFHGEYDARGNIESARRSRRS